MQRLPGEAFRAGLACVGGACDGASAAHLCASVWSAWALNSTRIRSKVFNMAGGWLQVQSLKSHAIQDRALLPADTKAVVPLITELKLSNDGQAEALGLSKSSTRPQPEMSAGHWGLQVPADRLELEV